MNELTMALLDISTSQLRLSSTRGPSLTGVKPPAVARARSVSLSPPSGPINRFRLSPGAGSVARVRSALW